MSLAVAAMGSEQLATRNITSLASFATRTTPGLVMNSFADAPSVPTFHMRGVSSPDPTAGLTEQRMAAHSDGVPLGQAPGVGIELGDIARIEVLRSPQRTLSGRASAAGVPCCPLEWDSDPRKAA